MSATTRPIHIWVPGIREGSGGIQAFSRTLVRAVREGFPDRPIRVLVRNEEPDPDDPLKSANISLHSPRHVPAQLRSATMAALGIMHGLRDRPVCTLSAHLHFLPALKLLRSLAGIPYAGALHGIEAWKIDNASRIGALRSADMLLAVSHFTRDRVMAEYGLPGNRISIVPNTLDESRFMPGPKPAQLLARYGLRPEQPVILTVSRLTRSERRKGHDAVIRALPRIIAELPDVRYIIAGEGEYREDLRKFAESCGVADHIVFPGFVPREELPDYYRLCDIFAMPSTKEGFGIVFLEAAACGKPVIAGNRDGSVDAVDGGRLGVLVDPLEPGQIAAAILSVLNKTHPNKLLFQSELLSSAVRERFGWNAFAQNVTRLVGTMMR